MASGMGRLPEKERPRERLDTEGAESLTDVELLSIVLRTGSRDRDVKELAAAIRSQHSFRDLVNVSRSELEEFVGVSSVKSGQLKAVSEIARRTKREQMEKLENLGDAEEFFGDMSLLNSEKMRVVYLNAGNEVLGEKEFEGSTSGVSISVSSIFRRAAELEASALVICHNHPSGAAEPTEADVSFTESAREAGEAIGIELLDHLIAGTEFYSFRKDSDVLG